MVMLAVNDEFLCRKANRLPGRTCNDMEAVDLQLRAAKDMEAYVDAKSGGPGAGWYRIVRSPSEARAAIEAGKLAVVLGIEVDYLFNCHDEGDLTAGQLRWQLDRYYALGVWHVFPIHFGNNGFGCTAFQNALEHATLADNPIALENRWGAISPLNPLATINAYDVATEDGTASGYEYRTGRRNVQGFTNLGETLIEEMISRGMIIDVDHMSARSKADTLDIWEAHHHPVVAGHVGFVEISHGGKSHEGQLLAAEVERIRSLGGMIGVIVHQGDLEEIDTWESPGQTVVPHICGHSSNSVAQAYLYGVSKMRGGPVAWGSDFNGYAGLPSPRFGPEACQGGTMPGAPPLNAVNYPFTVASSGEQMDRCVTGDRIFDIT
jgi:microsomal dipeptidase-like Zn-dependent dipeptidase